MKKILILAFLLLSLGTYAQREVPQSRMEQIYEEAKTPYKYGLAVAPADNKHKIDCPTVFREGDKWYMTYVVYNGKSGLDGRGYETWIAESDNLLEWRTLGRVLSYRDGFWDCNQRGGFPALPDMEWGGSYALQTYKGKHWMTYLGGEGTGYESVNKPLYIGLAWTDRPLGSAHEWQAQDYHPVSDPTHLMPHQVIGEVCNQCGPEAVYVTDVGQHQMWAAQYLRHAKSRGFITSGGLGTMGFGYGAAIGAQVALGKDHRVVMLTGDGSFHMNLNEGCTAVSYELPIITVIFDNQVLGMVRQWQTTFYEKRYSDTDPHRRTDFVKLAEGFGLKGYRCRNLPEFQAAFADAMKQKGPTWIECIIDKDEKVLPMIPGGGDINDIIME